MSFFDLKFSAGKLIGDTCFFSSLRMNGLYQMDMRTMEPKFVKFFPEEMVGQNSLHIRSFVYGDILGFIPWNSRHVHLYHMQTGEITAVPVKEDGRWSIVDQVLLGDWLWLFPLHTTQPLIKLNLKTLEIERVDEFEEWCRNNLETKAWTFVGGIAFDLNKVWLGVRNSNRIIEFNMETRSIQQYQTDIPNIFAVHKGHHGIWVTSSADRGKIYQWNSEQQRSTAYSCEGMKKNQTYDFSQVVEFGKNVYALPFRADFILKLNETTRMFEYFADYPEGFRFEDDREFRFLEYDAVENKLIFHPMNSNGLLVIDSEKTEFDCLWLNKKEMNFQEEPYKSYLEEQGAIKPVMKEGWDASLGEFISVFDSMDSGRKNTVTYGRKIYQALIK